ncbi:MAG: hypothetical protein Kow0098_12490 [Ignavibacteriaceae bacterium]
MKKKIKLLLIPVICFYLQGCSPEPAPIDYGTDNCELCKMLITDSKYGAEIVLKTSKIYKFDSVECLLEFSFNGSVKESEIHSKWVSDFGNPGVLLNLEKAYFLKNDNFRSPMGLNVLAVSSQDKLNELKSKYGGKVLLLDELIELVKTEGGFVDFHNH